MRSRAPLRVSSYIHHDTPRERFHYWLEKVERLQALTVDEVRKLRQEAATKELDDYVWWTFHSEDLQDQLAKRRKSISL